MTFGILNTLMLFGLFALAIPPLIHLLNRRRYDIVDWGAMQFLQVSETTRRRLLIEEILLMLLRMGLIGVMVLALAAPYAVSPVFATLGVRPNRDVVLLIDGSYSMNFSGTGKTPQETAKEWATAFVDDLAAGDSVAVLQAKQQVVPVLGELTSDLERVREAIRRLPGPRGGCDWPQAMQAAHKVLAASRRPQRDIVVLSDGQRFGWADENSLLRWELLANQLREQPGGRPGIWVINLDPHRPKDPPNWALAPIVASRAIASVGQQITFRTALQLHGQAEYQPPYQLRVEVDGRPVTTDLQAPASARLDKGQVPLSFHYRFTQPGSHLLSVLVEPDPPPEKRPAKYRIKDHLPGDNRQDLAVEVVTALPVLLVDGDSRHSPKSRGTDFLRDALAPARDLTPVVFAKVVPIQEFDPGLLTRDLGKPGSKPRVLVLSNVPRLKPDQQEAVAQFLASGGGLLVTLGARVDAPAYNDQLHRGGQGWLPARLDELAGDEAQPERAASPLPSSFFHPALDLFREVPVAGLADARFPRWWKVTTPGRNSSSVPVALLTSNDPLFVERAFPQAGGGRVVLCAVPLDNSWRTNLPDLPAFAPLAHELVYYLAGARSAEHNLQPGQPLRYRPDQDEALGFLSIQPPEGETKRVPVNHWPFDYEDTRETGVYRLQVAKDRTIYYVVQPDQRESNLTPSDDSDREKVNKQVPMTFQNDRDAMAAELSHSEPKQEMWWWLMVGVIALLCGEVWLTRRIVRNR